MTQASTAALFLMGTNAELLRHNQGSGVEGGFEGVARVNWLPP